MPAKGDTQINNFVKGYFTEATPLTFPQGASLDEINMKLLRNGSRERRLGLDYEDGATVANTGLTSEQLARMRQRVFVWPTPSGNVDYEIGVVQIGTFLFFLDLFSASPSSNRLNGGAGLDMRDVSSFITDSTPFDFAVINNNLLVVSAGLDTPFLLGYNAETDTILTATSRVKIRDLYGVNDNLSENTRPATLSKAHEYNLRNQGWDSSIVTTCGTDVLQCTKNILGVYPSNSDTWSLGKIADVTSADIDKYDPETLKRNSFDLGGAAKGHFIIDLYNRGNSREQVSGISVDNIDRELGRISTVTTLGGRAFYSGIVSKVVGEDNSPKLSGTVLFSQIVNTNLDLIKCYQEADPTSPNNSDIVDTDGGVIPITEASNIVKLLSVKSSVFVFAENGVWEIRGDEGGFRATNFQVNKVSSIGVLARESIVEANGTIFFWAREGIFALTPNQLGTGYDTTNLTLSTIQTAYNTIPNISNSQVKGYYDTANNTVRWLFNNETSDSIGLPDPAPQITEFSTASIVDATGSEPKVAKLNSTTAIVIYKKGASTDVFYRILTLEADLSVSVGSENTFVSVSPNNLNGFAITELQENKVIVAHSDSTNVTYCSIGNWSGSSMSFTSPTSVSTNFRSILITNQLEFGKISSSRVVLSGRYVTNFRPAAIVIDIDGSDNITNGSIAFSTTASSVSDINITMLTSTKGVLAWNGPITTEMEVFTITGTTITFNGTNYNFPNATQFPTASSFGLLNTSIEKTSSSSLIAVGEGTIVISGVTTYAPIVFNVSEAGGVLTSTTALQDATHNNGVSASTTRYFKLITENGDNLAITCSQDLATNKLWVTKYNGATPAQEYDLEIQSYTGTDDGRIPDIAHLGSGKYIVVSWNTISDSTITGYGVSAT